MAFVNEESGELFLKLVYMGAAGSGKTTNLQGLFKNTSPHVPFRHFDLNSFSQRSPYFEFLPLSLGKLRGQDVRLHIFTLPAHQLWETVSINIMSDADGVVNVVDTRMTSIHESNAHFERSATLLRYSNKQALPLVHQLNHRDAPSIANFAALKTAYGTTDTPVIEAVASKGIGVSETLELIVDRMLATHVSV